MYVLSYDYEKPFSFLRETYLLRDLVKTKEWKWWEIRSVFSDWRGCEFLFFISQNLFSL